MDEKNKPKQLIIKIGCFVAAFILWLYIYNVENPIKDRKITVPVQVVNVESLAQSKLAPIIDDKINITLTVRGNATDVYAVDSNDFLVEADLSSFAFKKGENKVPIEIKKSPNKIKVVNKDNLWVKIMLDEIVEKTVPIKVVFEGTVKEGYFAGSPEFKDKSVIVRGASTVVASIKTAIVKCDLKKSDKDIVFKGILQAQNGSGGTVEGVIIEPKLEEIMVPVRKIKSVGINVKFKENISTNSAITSILPINDKIDIAVKEEDYSKINSIDTEPIDVTKIEGQDTIEAKLVVPKDVYIVNSIENNLIKLKVAYKKVVEKEVSVEIKPVNLKSDFEGSYSDSKAVVTISGEDSIINNIKPVDINCYIDLSAAKEGENSLPVVANLPKGVAKVKITPETVKATLKKKILEGKNGN